MGFFKELCISIQKLDKSEKSQDRKIHILKELYRVFEQAKFNEDPYREFSHQLEKTFSSINKQFSFDSSVVKTIFRVFEDITLQKQKILRAGRKDPDKNEVSKEFDDIQGYTNPINIERLQEPIVTEAFYVHLNKNSTASKTKKSKKNEIIDIDVSQVEDIQNSFKEFMATYEGMIKTSREFWQMNLVEILRDLYSEKKDGEILGDLITKLYNEDFKKEKAGELAHEAADFLIKNRKNIVILCKIKKVFEKEEPKKNIKKDKQEFNKPTNFAVNLGKNSANDAASQIQQQDEDIFFVDNYEILTKLLVY